MKVYRNSRSMCIALLICNQYTRHVSGHVSQTICKKRFLQLQYVALKLSRIKEFEWPYSSVDIVTGYGLDGTGIESQWGGARFSAPVQTGPRAHPASCSIGTASFPGVKSGRGVTLTPYPLLVPWS